MKALLLVVILMAGFSTTSFADSDETELRTKINTSKGCLRSPCYGNEDNRFKRAVKSKVKNEFKEACYKQYKVAKKIRIEINCFKDRNNERRWEQVTCEGFATAKCK